MMATGERDGLSVEATARLLAAATFGGGAARGHAACEVVAGEDDLEVVGDEGAHVAVGVAYLVLRLVGLHHGKVSLGALGRRGGRAVLPPPGRGELSLLLEGGADSLLLLGVGIVNHMPVGTVGFARAFVHAVNHALLGAQLTRDGLNVRRESNFRHYAKKLEDEKMFWRKTWARILRLFHGEDIVFLTCRAAVFRLRVGLTVVLRWSYDSSHGKLPRTFHPQR
nr:MAG TPA: hypothetical protein [Caudoviricetes sp.]